MDGKEVTAEHEDQARDEGPRWIDFQIFKK